MNGFLVAVPAWLLAFAFVALACVCSVGIASLVRRVVQRGARGEHHNEVLGILMTAGGTFSAIVVALAIFVVWDHLTTARQAEVDAGASLIALYHDAETLPPPARAEVESAIRGYTNSMIDDEFPSLAQGESSDRTQRALSQLNQVVHRRLATTSAPDQVSNLARAQYQLELASEEGMPALLWVLLIGACLLLLLMAAPLFMESARYHALETLLLGAALGASLFLILVADHPFAGPLQVEPTDLVHNLHSYAVIDSVSGPTG